MHGAFMSVVSFARILCCCALAIATGAAAQPAAPAVTQPRIAVEPSPRLCIDQMEVEPGLDDNPMFVDDRIDIGCTADSDPVSI
jgi:hypothetical protein